MNMKLLQQARASVIDETKVFYLNSWETCIAARVAEAAGCRVSKYAIVSDVKAWIAGILGITQSEASGLIQCGPADSPSLHRPIALKRIDTLIAKYHPKLYRDESTPDRREIHDHR